MPSFYVSNVHGHKFYIFIFFFLISTFSVLIGLDCYLIPASYTNDEL